MGYYTRHELEIIEGNTDLIGEFVEENENAAYAIDEYGDSLDSCKWYDHEKDMREFSLKHPSTLFKLSGEGEESGDVWHEYYRNGKMQRCQARLVFDDFDDSKLQ